MKELLDALINYKIPDEFRRKFRLAVFIPLVGLILFHFFVLILPFILRPMDTDKHKAINQ